MNDKLNAPESLAILDDASWVWDFCRAALEDSGVKYLKVASSVPLTPNWERFRRAPFILLHWENRCRPTGAIIEEILDIDQSKDPVDRLIIVTTNPLHEDVVYFSELGVSRIVRARNRSEDFKTICQEIKNHIREITHPSASDEARWREIRLSVDRVPEGSEPKTILELERQIEDWAQKNKQASVRVLEAQAALALKSNNLSKASSLAIQAIDLNPNFFRAWKTLAIARRKAGDHAEAYALLQKMQLRNRSSIGRITAMGEELLALNDLEKAETLFVSAINQDSNCAAALNGLAEVKFSRGNLDDAKRLLEKSSSAHLAGAKLNRQGVDLARQGKYHEALEHYTKAQYVLPEQSKAHQLYYNIGLCYLKWGKPTAAKQFLQLSLIKNPDYKKAKRLIEDLKTDPTSVVLETDRP